MTLANQIAEFTSGLRYGDIPADVSRCVGERAADTIGVACANHAADVADSVLSTVQRLHAVPEATVWTTGRLTADNLAALVNGTLAHASDFDDTHPGSVTHCSAVVLPAALATCERLTRSGSDAVVAAVAGYEVMIRLGELSPGGYQRNGFHPTSVCGTLAAAVATGKALDLPEHQLTSALGIAGSQASGIQEFLSDGSWTKRLHPGWAAHAGMMAADLAQNGFIGPATVIEGRYGLLHSHAPGATYDLTVFDDLGKRWACLEIEPKEYPCCHITHPYINAALVLRAAAAVDEIALVTLHVSPAAIPIVCEPWSARLAPSTEYISKFSLPFCVAAALVDGAVGPSTFAKQSWQRPNVRRLLRKCRYEVDTELGYPGAFAGRVTITMATGSTLDQRWPADHTNSDSSFARSPDRQRAKFAANLAGRGLASESSKLWNRFLALAAEPSIEALLHELRDGATG